MDPALIALPATTLITGGLLGFLMSSIAFDRQSRVAPPLAVDHLGNPPLPFVTGTDDEGWTQPPRMVLSGESREAAQDLMAEFAKAQCNAAGVLVTSEPLIPISAEADMRYGSLAAAGPAPEPPAASLVLAEHAELASSAVRRTAQALAELTRFLQEGPASDRFPMDEGVETFLAKALQDTINILLAHQPTEHERGELAQLEAALHKFITDYGA